MLHLDSYRKILGIALDPLIEGSHCQSESIERALLWMLCRNIAYPMDVSENWCLELVILSWIHFFLERGERGFNIQRSMGFVLSSSFVMCSWCQAFCIWLQRFPWRIHPHRRPMINTTTILKLKFIIFSDSGEPLFSC